MITGCLPDLSCEGCLEPCRGAAVCVVNNSCHTWPCTFLVWHSSSFIFLHFLFFFFQLLQFFQLHSFSWLICWLQPVLQPSHPTFPLYTSTAVTCRPPASHPATFFLFDPCPVLFVGGYFVVLVVIAFCFSSSSVPPSCRLQLWCSTGFLQHSLAWVSCQTDWRLSWCPRARANISSVLMLYAFLTR